MNWQKWQKFIRSKGLEPRSNRKKFGSILFGATIVVFFLFILRFTYIIGFGKVGDTSLDIKTQQLYQGSSVVKAKRGSIYDRNGVAIAEDATSYSLYAVLDKTYLGLLDPKTQKQEILYAESKNFDKIADILNKYLKIKKADGLKQLNQKKNTEGFAIKRVEFGKEGKGISLEMKDNMEAEFEKAEIKGVYFDAHPARIYPNGVYSPYLIGYTALADDSDESKGLLGQMGIEKMFNKQLNGQDGEISFQRDSRGNPLPGTINELKEAKDGVSIYTTLDDSLQSLLESSMTESMEKYGAEDITAMLVEAKTGNILAASQRPAFNPETLEGLDKEGAQWQNLLVEQPYEPGSTMKVFTVAAAIETGNFNPNATFLTGKTQVDDKQINDHIREGVGTITYRQALAWSSNVGMVHLQQAMDMKWIDYLNRFGFGKSTNSGLPPAEHDGFIRTDTTVDRAMTAYGQAISVTPFQMIQGFTAIANGGQMMKPNFISKVVKADGTETVTQPEVVGQPITENTAKQVLDMMTDVVEDQEYGTGKTYKLENYRVSAKTGTAEIAEEQGYLLDEYLYSAVQIAPTEDPEYIMYVTMRKPTKTAGVQPAVMISEISNTVLERALNIDASNRSVDASNK